ASYARLSARPRFKEAAMKTNNKKMLSRRDVLKGGGVLVVGFALGGVSNAATTAKAPRLDLGPYGPPEDQLDFEPGIELIFRRTVSSETRPRSIRSAGRSTRFLARSRGRRPCDAVFRLLGTGHWKLDRP